MYYSVKNTEWQRALALLGERYGFSLAEDGREVELTIREGKSLIISAKEDKIEVKGPTKSSVFRGFGHVVQKEKEGVLTFELEEELIFPFNGLMADCSRNGVVNMKYAKELIERLAVMGHSVFMLYMEDVYEVDEEPYFGYLRGRYSKKDIQELDAYAKEFGVELIPCIQTLAHLDQFLMWEGMAENYLDIDNILWVRNEKVTDLLKRMIKTLSECVTSNRIHIGMDEAYKLGRGRYADKNGLEKKTDIMTKHLKDMLEICNEYGMRPMIWDDMFFSGYSSVGKEEYRIPEGIDLMYWDYYNNKKEHYTENFEFRKKLTPNTMFAGGAWRWVGYTPHHSKTYASVNASLSACKEEGIKEVIVTAWGDDGSESPISTCLFGTVLFGEHGYKAQVDLEDFKKRLTFITGLSYDDFMMQEAFDIIPEVKEKTATVTPSKYLFYEDPLMSIFVDHTKTMKDDLTAYYNDLAESFQERAKIEKDHYYKILKEFYGSYAKVMALKWNLGLNIWNAYQNKDKDQLKAIIDTQIVPLIPLMEDFKKARMIEWNETNKAYGFEALDLRFGGIIARLHTTKYRLGQYLNGNIDSIEELEEQRLPAVPWREESAGEILHFNRALRSMAPARLTW